MKREKITINKRLLRSILYEEHKENYVLMYDKITGSDPEDGGADHEAVIKRKEDGKFFRVHYTDWDMDYNFERDFPETLTEVFPRQRTTTVYE